MAREARVLRILVIGPNDVESDMIAVEDAVEELNETGTIRCRFEVLTWRTFGTPAVGNDPQAILNEDMPDDLDIVVGLFWTRLGTRTPRAESGTIEEVQEAINRQEQGRVLRVMLYRKSAAVRLSDTDLEQATRLKDFLKEMQPKALFGQYENRSELEREMRIKLRRIAEQALLEPREAPSEAPVEEIEGEATIERDDDEEGFLDLIEIGRERMNAATGRTKVIVGSMETMNAEIRRAATGLQGEQDPTAAKATINTGAEAMIQYADDVDANLPVLVESFNESLDKISRAAAMQRGFARENSGDVEDTLQSVRRLRTSIEGAITGTKQFRPTVARLPRMTSNLVLARKRVLRSIDDILQNFEGLSRQANQTEENLQRLLTDDDSNSED